MTISFRRAMGPVLAAALTGLLAGCGAGGFSSAPPTRPDETIHSYVALGDTFTAAPHDESAGDEGCVRSHENYPALVAEELEVADVRDVSCTGATTSSLTTESKAGKDKTVPPQIDAVQKDTGLVTIGAGLGDRDLLPRAFQMCTALPCGDKVTPQATLDDVNAMSTSLISAVRAIRDKAPESYIVLVGYPKITPDSGSCDALPELDQPGLDAANQVLGEINREIRSAARETGVAFLDVARLSLGHELCSGDPWVVKPKDAEGAPASASIEYHPVATEQHAVADALAALVRNQ